MLEKYGTILAITIAAGLGGAYLGYQYCDGQNAKATASAQDALIARLGKEALTDKQEAVARARREAVAAERARAAHGRGVEDAILKAKPGCDRDDESLRLLTDAINEANGTGGAGGMPDKVPAGTGTSNWLGPVRKALGVRHD